MAPRVKSDLLLVGSLPADSADSALRAAAGFFGDLVFALPDGETLTAASPQLAAAIEAELDAGRLPDLDVLTRRFAPDPAAILDITVELTPLHLYDELGTVRADGAA